MGVMDSFEQLQAAKAECVRLERELAAALAVIEKAPHGDLCDRVFPFFRPDTPRPCTCWKSSVDTSALAERDAETRRKALLGLADEDWLAMQDGISHPGFVAAWLRALTEGGENR